MKGGTFTPGLEKTRPGIYINFSEVARERLVSGESGTVLLPVETSWGEPHKYITLNSLNDATQAFRDSLSNLLPIREAFKGASRVIAYRLNGGEVASGTSGGLTVTAAHPGALGNDITVSVTESLSSQGTHNVKTYLRGSLVDEQVVSAVGELVANGFVTFEGELATSPSIKLTQGANTPATAENVADFLSGALSLDFNTVALPVADEDVKAMFVGFIRDLREDNGKKVQGVVSDYSGVDYEGVINVVNGVVLEDGTEVPAELATAFVAGLSAGSTYTRSLTSMVYPGAIDVIGGPQTHDEIVGALNSGQFLFALDPKDQRVYIEQDINSLKAPNSILRKNKIMRLLDMMANDFTYNLKAIIAQRKATGQDIPANDDGVQIVQSMIIGYLRVIEENAGIQPFNVDEDILVEITSAGDGFTVNLGITPIDAAEKFYFTVEVR